MLQRAMTHKSVGQIAKGCVDPHLQVRHRCGEYLHAMLSKQPANQREIDGKR
jgi:hypothetical protein